MTINEFNLLTFEEQVEHYEGNIEKQKGKLEEWEERLRLAVVGCMAGALFYHDTLLEFYNNYINLNRDNGRKQKEDGDVGTKKGRG